jgi:transposase
VASKTVAIYKDGFRIYSHIRSRLKGRYTTVLEHLPTTHREYKQWTPSKIISWAKSIGKNTGLLVEQVIEKKQHPVLGYRSALGIIRLGTAYGTARVEAAAIRAIEYNAYSFQSVKSILKKGLDKQTPEKEPEANISQNHINVRGAAYYQSKERGPC